MRVLIHQIVTILLSYCLLLSVMVGPSNAFAAVSPKEQEQISFTPSTDDFSTQSPQEQESGLIQTEYLEAQYLETEYEETQFLETEYQETQYLKTKYEESQFLETEYIEIVYYEAEFIPLDGEMMEMVEEHLKSVYGEDFDLQQFLIDVSVGAACLVVYGTVVYATGGTGAFLGIVLTKGLATSLVVWMGMDGAAAAFKEYKDGGDAISIAGHTLNGVAKGFRSGAVWAPVETFPAGVKVFRTYKALREIPVFKDITFREAAKVTNEAPSILRKAGKIDPKDKKLVQKVYREWVKENAKNPLSKEISPELFEKILRHQTDISAAIRVPPQLINNKLKNKEAQDNFLKNIAGFEGNTGREYIKKIQRGEILADKLDIKIRQHLYEFISLFGNKLPKPFLDSLLKSEIRVIVKSIFKNATKEQVEVIEKELFSLIQQNITTKQFVREVLNKYRGKTGREIIGKIAEKRRQNALYAIISQRYGIRNMLRFEKQLDIYNRLGFIDDMGVRAEIYEGIQKGGYKTIEDILNMPTLPANVRKGLRKKLANNSNLLNLANAIREAGLRRSYPFVDSIVSKVLTDTTKIPAEVAKDIVLNRLTKQQIIEKYGKDVYLKLVEENYFHLVAGSALKNQELIEAVAQDILEKNGIGKKAIAKIKQGESINALGLSEKEQEKIAGFVMDYYKTKDFPPQKYQHLLREWAQVRVSEAEKILNKCKSGCVDCGPSSFIHKEFAGMQMEANKGYNDVLMQARYGSIYMNEFIMKGIKGAEEIVGFPIFDAHAVARVKLPNLTGQREDMIRANEMVFGTTDGLAGYTWHHLENGKEMILIPTDLHESYRHTGGASIIRECMVGIK